MNPKLMPWLSPETIARHEAAEAELLQAARHTGFVPCPAHAREVVEGRTTLEALIVGRVCPVAFPLATGSRLLKLFVAWVARHE